MKQQHNRISIHRPRLRIFDVGFIINFYFTGTNRDTISTFRRKFPYSLLSCFSVILILIKVACYRLTRDFFLWSFYS